VTLVQDLIDAVVQEASFDVTNTQATAWLNRKHKLMVVRARALRETIAAGNTTANSTGPYTLPTSIVEVYEFDVGGLPYTRGRRTDIAADSQGLLSLYSPDGAGLVTVNASSAGAVQFSIVPAPTSVQAISLFAAVRPADLNASDDTTLLVPAEHHEGLIAGAMEVGYRREGNIQLALAADAKFNAACEEWRVDLRRQQRGSGPAQIRVVGINA
jgi:hypothetical protein